MTHRTLTTRWGDAIHLDEKLIAGLRSASLQLRPAQTCVNDARSSDETRRSVFVGHECGTRRTVLRRLRNCSARDSAGESRDGATHRSRTDRRLLYRAALLQTRLQILGLRSQAGPAMELSGDGDAQ